MFSRDNILYGVGAVCVSVSLFYSGYWYGGRNVNLSVDNTSSVSGDVSGTETDDDK